MKKILIIVLALGLSGCGTINQDFQKVTTAVKSVVTPDNFDSITLAYYSTLASGNAYRDACERKIINKSCWNIIEKLQPYENKAFNTYMVLKRFVKTNPTLDASGYIQLTRDAINALVSNQTANGVK